MKSTIFLLAASVGLLVGCSDLNEFDLQETIPLDEGELVERVIFEAPVIRSLGEDDDTRASLSQEGEGSIRFAWEATDIVGICPNEGTQVAFEMTDGVGTNVASFDGGGWALRKGYTYSCYFPLVDELFLDRDAIPVSFANQVQNGVSNYKGVNFYLASEGTSSEAGALRFTFQMLNTVIRIKAIGLPPGTYTKMSISTDEPLFVREGTFGLDDMTITGRSYSNMLEIALNDFTLAETSTEANPVLIYLTSAPVDLRGHTVCIRVYSDDDIIYGCEKNPGKAYEAGAWGGLKCEMERILTNNVIYYTSADGNIVTPNTETFGSASIVSNEYIDGTGIITFDEEVTTIENNAFQYCTTLSSIVFPASLTDIGDFAFYECSGFTGSLILPAGLISIGTEAFYNCTDFTGSLVLPAGLASIGNRAFFGCSGFTGSLNLPASLTSIGHGAFYSCSGFTGSLTIPDSVTSIGNYTFYGCSGFTGNLIIPEGVTSIGDYAFCRCSGFTGSLTIPDGVTCIGDGVFEDCSGFTGSLTIPDSVTCIGGGVFEDCSGFMGSLIIPEGVTSIGDYAFCRCSGFTGSLTIPDGVTCIGDGVFYSCSGFTGSLTIPDSVTSIGNSTFYGCSGFTGSLTLPDGLTSIGDRAFNYCSGFTSLTLPAGLTDIGKQVFQGCSGFTGSLTLPDGLTSIGDDAFNECSGFTGSLTIPDGVTSIGRGAFYSCSGFTGSLVLPDGLMSIGEWAFFCCSGFTGGLIIPEGVTSIGDRTFNHCFGFTSLTLPAGLTSIGQFAFSNCFSLNEIIAVGATPPSGGVEMFGNTNNCPIYVPSESIEEYKNAEVWREYADRIRGAQGGEVPDIPGEEE